MWSRDWRPAAPTFPPGVNIRVHHAASFILSLSRFQVYNTIISHEKQQGGAGGYSQVGAGAQVSKVIHYIANSFSIITPPGLIHHLDTKKSKNRMAVKTKLGVNLVVPGSTKDLDSTKGPTTALPSIKAPTRDRISTRGQVQAIVAVQIQASTRAQTTTKGQVGSATTTMAIQLPLHPALMLS